MKNRRKKLLTIFLAAMLMLGLLAAAPLAADAKSGGAIIDLDESWYGTTDKATFSQNWEYKKTTNTIQIHSDVTVVGEQTGVTKSLKLSIDPIATVTWKAEYSGSVNGLILLNGSGRFEVAEGGAIKNNATGYTIWVESNQTISVTVRGGTVSGKGGPIISATSANAAVTVTGGTVESTDGNGSAISAVGKIEITGGTVSATGTSAAISGQGPIEIKGGTVLAATGYAIAPSSPSATVALSGGFMFAHVKNSAHASGTPITAGAHIIENLNTATAINGNAILCAWNKPSGAVPSYEVDTATDLIVSPSAATAKWAEEGDQGGIRYANGTNEGFLQLSRKAVKVITPPQPSMSYFVPAKRYDSGRFVDVDENAWYGLNQQKVIASVYEYGLMKGNSGDTFNPAGKITVAEAITIAARLHATYITGDSAYFKEYDPSYGAWYQVYVDYALATGIIKYGDFTDYSQPATRAEMASIFSRSLPESEFAPRNAVGILPDVTSSTPHRDAIIMLYKAGVLIGSDDHGTFRPAATITRAESAAIISRVILPATRISKTFVVIPGTFREVYHVFRG